MHLLLGLTLSLGLFALMERMGVDRRIALIIAFVFTVSPATVLYENLLFYEYPLTLLLCIAALFLHRYASEGCTLNAAVFFCCLALIAGIRSIYHFTWFATIAAFTCYALRRWTRGMIVALALPGALVTSFYLKNLLLFHSVVPGASIYGPANFASMSALPLRDTVLPTLIASGTISPLLTRGVCGVVPDLEHSRFADIVPPPKPSGVPILDSCLKTTGRLNFNCRWLADIEKQCGKDARIVFRQYPKPYIHSILVNARRYFLPTTDKWPFDGRPPGGTGRRCRSRWRSTTCLQRASGRLGPQPPIRPAPAAAPLGQLSTMCPKRDGNVFFSSLAVTSVRSFPAPHSGVLRFQLPRELDCLRGFPASILFARHRACRDRRRIDAAVRRRSTNPEDAELVVAADDGAERLLMQYAPASEILDTQHRCPSGTMVSAFNIPENARNQPGESLRLSIAIPLHNEEDVIPELLKRLSSVLASIQGGPHEVAFYRLLNSASDMRLSLDSIVGRVTRRRRRWVDYSSDGVHAESTVAR